jgi:hypothetical protein
MGTGSRERDRLSGADESRDWPSFRIDLDLTDAEIADFQRIVLARQRGPNVRGDSWIVLAASFGLALVVGWLMTQAGVNQPEDEGLISVVIFAVFWLGGLAPSLLWRRTRRRLLQDGLRDMRERWRGAKLLINPRGMFVRLPDALGFHRRSAIKAVSLERGLVVLWASPETARAAVAIPVRLLQPGQKQRLLGLGQPSEPIK